MEDLRLVYPRVLVVLHLVFSGCQDCSLVIIRAFMTVFLVILGGVAGNWIFRMLSCSGVAGSDVRVLTERSIFGHFLGDLRGVLADPAKRTGDAGGFKAAVSIKEVAVLGSQKGVWQKVELWRESVYFWVHDWKSCQFRVKPDYVLI